MRHCPNCQHEAEAETCITGEARPAPGDYSICFYCFAVLEFFTENDFVICQAPPAEVLRHANRLREMKARMS